MPERTRPLIAAHRGLTASAIENTLDAIAGAIELGCELVELDVRRTRDGALVLFHDASVEGTPVAQLTRGQLAARAGHVPPLLEEAVALASRRIALDVELKEAELEAAALEQLAAFEPPAPAREARLPREAATAAATRRGLLVSSFLGSAISELGRLEPSVRRGLILGESAGRSPADWLRRADGCRAQALVLKRSLLGEGEPLAAVAASGRAALVWDANADGELEALLEDPRVEAIITDRPQRALELRAQGR